MTRQNPRLPAPCFPLPASSAAMGSRTIRRRHFVLPSFTRPRTNTGSRLAPAFVRVLCILLRIPSAVLSPILSQQIAV